MIRAIIVAINSLKTTHPNTGLMGEIKNIPYANIAAIGNIAAIAAIETHIARIVFERKSVCLLPAIGIISIAYAIDNVDLSKNTAESTAQVVFRRVVNVAAMVTLVAAVFNID